MTTETGIVKYAALDLDELEAQEKAIGFGGGKGAYFAFKDGKNLVRLLPGLFNMKALIPFWKHFVGGNGGDGKAWGGACPLKMIKATCPVCSAATKLSRGTDADRKLAKDITARQRYVANLVDRNNPDAGPQIVEFGPQIYNDIKDLVKATGEDPTNPGEAGFDLIIEKTGSGMGTEYKVVAQRKNSPLHQDVKQLNEWLQAAHDLSQVVVVQAEHEIAGRLGGTVISHLLGGSRPAGKGRKPVEVDEGSDDAEPDVDY